MSQQNRTALIVDNSSENRELYRRYLLRDSEYSYRILEATLGRQGLELWQQHQPDVVLLDYRLPDLDGLEFLVGLHSSTQLLCFPVIVVTGQGNEAIAVQAMKAGAQDYLVKDQITPERLKLAVDGAIEAVQLRTQRQQRIDRDRVVAKITRQSHQFLDLDQILQATVTEVRQFLHPDRVLVLQLEPDGNGTVIAESVGAEWRSLLSLTISDPCLAQNSLRRNQPEPVSYDSAFAEKDIEPYHQGQVTALSDIQDSRLDPCHVELLAQFQVKANLVVPILHDDQVWGWLMAHHCAAPRTWQPLEIDLLQELATQVGIAIRHRELYQQAQNELAERRQVEAELRESEERLRLALKASRMGMWDWNVQAGLIQWSDNLEALFGLEPGEFNGSFEMFVSRLHPDDRDRVLAAINHAIITGEDYDIEFRVVYPNGRIRWALSQGKVFYDQNGQPIRMAGNDIDITERKRSAEALQDSEERFRTAVENMLDCFAIYRAVRNEQGAIVDFQAEYINDAACLMSQITREQHLRQGLCELLPAHRDSRLFDEYCQVVETGQSLVKDSLIYEDQFGQQRLTKAFDIRVAKFGDGYIATWREITERIHTQLLLQESEARLKLAYKATRSGLWDWDIPCNSAHVSEEYCNLFGLDPTTPSVTYEQWLSHLHPDDRASASEGVSRTIEQRQEYYEADYRILYPVSEAGRDRVLGIRWLASRGQVFYDAAGNAVRMLGNVQDITERKQVQESLRQSEEFKRRMLESSSDCIKLLDLDGRLLYMNTGGMQLLEIDDIAPYINTDWTSFWQDDECKTAEVALTTAKAGETCRFQGFSPTATGTLKWWDVVVTPIFDTAGHVVQLLATSRDITERKQSEEALRESEERFRTLADNMSQFAWMADANGWIFWYNRRWFEYTGTTLEEMQGWGWQKVHHPDHVDRVVQYIRHCFETGKLWEDTFPLRGQNGQYRWFLSRAIPIKDEKGIINCWFGTNTDIDDRKQAEEALRQSEERYRCLAELIPQLVWTANAEGELLDVNQRWLDFTGLTLEQVHTIGWAPVVHPEDLADLVQKWNEAVQRGTYYQAEGRMRRADGVYRWHLHQAIGQKNEQGHIVKWFGTATDIDAQKQLEVERDRLLQLEQTARVEAERANRIKDEFLAILSHELRSPLNPILGWTKLLQTRKFDETKTAEALATIERNAKLQTQLIDDLLDIAKILRGKLSLNTAPVNLAFVIESAIDTVRTAAISKSILLHTELPHLGQVSGDDPRLQQIVWNLLSNAIKFTPKGGRVDIKLEQVGDQAQLSVSDTGKGINPEFLPYIFESFRQEDVSTTRKYGGLGLGLAIVRSLVEAHGGTISAESLGEGQGATFTVRLPLLDAEPQIEQTDKFSEQELNLTGIRVLTVDDEPDVRELFSVLLTKYGAEVLTVASAAEVLATLESFQPDVLVSDIGLPEMDGYTLLQQVRSLPADKGGQIPAIALTAYARGEDRERCLACGFQQHISKPVDIEMLVQTVSNLARAN